MSTPSPIIIRSSLGLGVICLAAAILLATAYSSTREQIRQQQLEAERRALNEVLPGNHHDNDLLQNTLVLGQHASELIQPELLELTSDHTAYLAYQGGMFSGTILPVQAHDGYSGDISMLVGILADGSISGVRVLEHQETPGLGDKIDIRLSDWILTFNGKALDNPEPAQWQVKKDGGEFDQLVGATVTPRAVVNAVHRALQFFNLNQSHFTGQ